MLEKLSSMRMMSDASFATSVPAIPILENVRQIASRVDVRESDVGRLERRSIVRAVTRDSDDLAHALEMLDEDLLVLRGRAREHLQPGDDLIALRDGQFAEHGALHDDPASGVDAALRRDRASREDVVAEKGQLHAPTKRRRTPCTS